MKRPLKKKKENRWFGGRLRFWDLLQVALFGNFFFSGMIGLTLTPNRGNERQFFFSAMTLLGEKNASSK